MSFLLEYGHLNCAIPLGYREDGLCTKDPPSQPFTGSDESTSFSNKSWVTIGIHESTIFYRLIFNPHEKASGSGSRGLGYMTQQRGLFLLN